jgi:hypothetical protein
MRNVLFAVATLLLSACAIVGPDASNPRSCVLGADLAAAEFHEGLRDDPVDSLITRAVDEGRDDWLCRPARAARPT